MATARIGLIATLHHDAYRQLGHALQAVRTRLADRRQDREARRMLMAAQQMDHPGVLADVQAACTPAWQRRAQ